MTTSAVPLAQKLPGNSNQIKRVKVGFAMAAAVAAAYGTRRIFIKRSSGFRKYKHRFEDWLVPRIETLSSTIGISTELASKIANEIHATAQATLCMGHASRKVKPDKRDLIEIGLEKRILKMKKRIHRMLDFTEATQASALHEFYEELREWLIPDGREKV